MECIKKIYRITINNIYASTSIRVQSIIIIDLMVQLSSTVAVSDDSNHSNVRRNSLCDRQTLSDAKTKENNI